MKNARQENNSSAYGLRITDQETARAVAILSSSHDVVGAGCLLSSKQVLTCRHVVRMALDHPPKVGSIIKSRLIGVVGQPKTQLRVIRLGSERSPTEDLALLEILQLPHLSVSPVQFSAPLRHSGKKFSAFGFPQSDSSQQGRNARGTLNAADAVGLVQMDGGSPLLVEGGFSGSPVWCADVAAFVGIVVTELSESRVAWCIPSRILSQFYPELPVRFRMPPADRPLINDYEIDDPNSEIFGTSSKNETRKLTATIREERKNHFAVRATYRCLDGVKTCRGKYVTFLTHPSFSKKFEDAYELFSVIDEGGRATVEFYLTESFTLAAIGDAGDTALTFDLSRIVKAR